jgi:hypothetical protein
VCVCALMCACVHTCMTLTSSSLRHAVQSSSCTALFLQRAKIITTSSTVTLVAAVLAFKHAPNSSHSTAPHPLRNRAEPHSC